MGVVVIITVLLMGVEYSSPLKNAKHIDAIPKNAARTKCPDIRTGQWAVWAKTDSLSKKRLSPPMSRINKAKSLYIGGHDIFGNSMV